MEKFERKQEDDISHYYNFETGCHECGGRGCRKCLKNYDELMDVERKKEVEEDKYATMSAENSDEIEKKQAEEEQSDEGHESRCSVCESTDYNDVSCSQCGFGRTKQPIKK